jgi:DNA-directed RNA polymerase subunit RPC12/RpoP
MTTFKRPGLACEKCGEPFSLFLATEGKKLEELPDPFQAKCPRCGHEATYPKSSIQTLVAVGGR